MKIWVEDFEQAPAYDMNCDVCGRRIWLDWPWPFGKRIKSVYAKSDPSSRHTHVMYVHGGKCEKMAVFIIMDRV